MVRLQKNICQESDLKLPKKVIEKLKHCCSSRHPPTLPPLFIICFFLLAVLFSFVLNTTCLCLCFWSFPPFLPHPFLLLSQSQTDSISFIPPVPSSIYYPHSVSGSLPFPFHQQSLGSGEARNLATNAITSPANLHILPQYFRKLITKSKTPFQLTIYTF